MNPWDFDDLLVKVKEALNHGKKFESRAPELYIDLMKVKLRHFVLVRETGLVIPDLASFFSRWTCCIPNKWQKATIKDKVSHT